MLPSVGLALEHVGADSVVELHAATSFGSLIWHILIAQTYNGVASRHTCVQLDLLAWPQNWEIRYLRRYS
jgi:hypothetical protein